MYVACVVCVRSTGHNDANGHPTYNGLMILSACHASGISSLHSFDWRTLPLCHFGGIERTHVIQPPVDVGTRDSFVLVCSEECSILLAWDKTCKTKHIIVFNMCVHFFRDFAIVSAGLRANSERSG